MQDKIKLAEDGIKKHYQLNNGNIFVSFNSGKDSKVRPAMTFAAVIKTHNFLLVSKEVSQKVYELKHSTVSGPTNEYKEHEGQTICTKCGFVIK